MHNRSSTNVSLSPAAAILALSPLLPASGACAGDALPDRPGYGDAIEFTTGSTAEALLPVVHRALPDRQGFGYVIVYLPGDPADELYPPGWTPRRDLAGK